MQKLILVSALSLLCAPAFADTHVNVDCDVESDYDFSLTERSVVFTREDESPGGCGQGGADATGRLFVDDQWVALDPADSKRVADYEREARAMMPLLAQVGRDATEIAFTALGEVAVGFSDDPAETRAKLAKARAQLDARLARSVTAKSFNSEDLGNGIRDAVREALPTVMGDVVGGTVRALFSGDTSRLQRMENMDKEIEARIGPRARRWNAMPDSCARGWKGSIDRERHRVSPAERQTPRPAASQPGHHDHDREDSDKAI